VEFKNRKIDGREIAVIFATMAAGCIAAGLYGMLHNQISYTVGPEYFTRFKFAQFGFEGMVAVPDRARAAMVGFLASWWMGIPIGLLVVLPGLRHGDWRRMMKDAFASFAIVIGVAMLSGLCGLLFGYLRTAHLKPALYSDWYVPNHVVHLRRFLCAGYMHNSSYLGGVLGIPAAWLFQFSRKAP
jgi:hypothetical protein